MFSISPQHQRLPLCIDLDGTLVRTDLFHESLVRVLRKAPWRLLSMPLWLCRGKHHVKSRLADIAQPNVETLPYNPAVLDLVRDAKSQGRRTILVTGSNILLARRVQGHLGLFDEVLASDDEINLTGARKAERLTSEFGHGQFEYAGNGHVDRVVWDAAGAIVTVNAPGALVSHARMAGKPHIDVPQPRASARQWLKQIRLHQWAKNLLIFVPLLAAHAMFDPSAVFAAAIAFVCFGLMASATYILNDLMDLDADRSHQTKRHRPIAAGVISIRSAVLASAGMLAAGLGLALTLPDAFLWAMATYLAATLSYSLGLKRVASLDIVILAGLYTIRIIAGAFAIGVPLSFWLLALSMFLFLCLALVKRVAELVDLAAVTRDDAVDLRPKGREYRLEDITVLQTLGAASGYLAVLVVALYINSIEVQALYRSPELLWLVVPLALLWVTRIWVVTARGYMHEDPIVFAIKDPETWLTAAAAGAIVVLAALVELDFY